MLLIVNPIYYKLKDIVYRTNYKHIHYTLGISSNMQSLDDIPS
jgi:hypothetical protein